MNRENNFDFLRLVFAILVAVGHTLLLVDKNDFRNPVLEYLPNTGVQFFFIISGMLIPASFERSSSLYVYLENRIRRIFPAYITVIVFFAVILFFISGVSAKEYFNKTWLQYIISNLLTLNFLQPTIDNVFQGNKIHAVNGSLWTIKNEICFYLITPLIFYFIKNKGKLFKNVVILVAYSISVLYLYTFGQSTNYTSKIFLVVFMYFCAGIIMYQNYDYFRKNLGYWIFPAVIIFVIEKLLFYQTLLSPLAMGIIIHGLAYANFGNFIKNFGKNWGDLSYGIYLIHFPMVQVFIAKGFFERTPYITAFICWISIAILSKILWEYVEKPMLKRKF